eukprot:scaffold185857_cov38-Prasinocladus_malaysianus.AAC.1
MMCMLHAAESSKTMGDTWSSIKWILRVLHEERIVSFVVVALTKYEVEASFFSKTNWIVDEGRADSRRRIVEYPCIPSDACTRTIEKLALFCISPT